MKKKGKHTTKYAGHPSKEDFEVFVQNTDTSCGAACLRMLEQWANGWSYSEERWRMVAKTTEADGTSSKKMRKALTSVEGVESESIDAVVFADWRNDPNLPPINENTVYLLEMDWYLRDARNLGHWIIVVDFFESEEKNDHPPQRLAYYANSVSGECEVWLWKSLLHHGVHSAFRVTRKRSLAAP